MTVNYKMIVVDDEQDICETLADYFELQGFDVKMAANGRELKALLPDFSPHIVLLDLNMPGEDGFTLTRYLRGHTSAGVIMVTAAAEQVDMIVGLEMGADDYVSKPFDLRALLARVRSVLRRIQNELPANSQPVQDARKKIGKCLLDVETRKLWEGEMEIPLTAMEYDLLMVFLQNPNRPLSRDYLLELAHKIDADPFDRSIDSRITRMRKKIEPDPDKPAIIKTVRSVGYVYVPNA
ncbi:MAG: DNA-binding response regulator [Cellvibrio sp.]|jgi:two-component system phosphate regulon response regulator OmpR|nr:DNA-binding response regulator [Cellvibrio sp.]